MKVMPPPAVVLNAVTAGRGTNWPIVMAGLVDVEEPAVCAPRAKPMLPVPMFEAAVCATPVVIEKHMIAVAAVVEAGLKVKVGTELIPAPLSTQVIATTCPERARVALTVKTAAVVGAVSFGHGTTVTFGATL